MKTNNKFFMLIFISLISVGVNGQNHKSIPEWYLSEDVQRINNKSYFERLNKSQLTVKSLDYPYWVISKGVTGITNPINNESRQSSGNIVSTGYPYWTISKSIQQRK